MLAQVTHILGLAGVRRVRMLPVAGRVLVSTGQRVHAGDVVAETQAATRHILLDVRRSLNFQRVADAERAIQQHEGERVQKGDVIAETGGMFSRIVRAPDDGQIVTISGGRVLLAVESKPQQIFAGINGVVTDVYPERGAAIEGSGGLIQGAWGNGGMVGEGLMVTLLKAPEDELKRTDMEVSLRGAIVVAGYCGDAEVLRIAATLPLRGLVLASMTSELIPVAQGMEFPIMVLEGFGRVPMNGAAFRLLSTSDKRDVSIYSAFNPAGGERPELFIPLPSNGEMAQDTAYFAPGKAVRIQGDPYRGKTGVITQVRPGMTVLPNGIRAPAADVRLEQETQVIIPLANLEILE
ncbi:MAG: hypothetical protein HY835_09165 [Anaerolineae bacterium]|nr:hypothetical protein [Anaerolineae bacterium]